MSEQALADTVLLDQALTFAIRQHQAGAVVSCRALAEHLGVSLEFAWSVAGGIGLLPEDPAAEGLSFPAGFEPLSAGGIRTALPRQLAELLAGLEVRSVVRSTNDELLRSPPRGDRPQALLAERQTHGHGRRGRGWVSPLGTGIYLSVRWPGVAAAGHSVAIALELARRLRELGVRATVKWPNDLYVDGRKLGGILVEQWGQGERSRCVVGVGLNYRGLPALAGMACGLDELLPPDGRPSRNAYAARALAAALAAWLRLRSEPLVALLEDWAAYDAYPDAAVTLADGTQGRARGIDELGLLRVQVDDGMRHCGDTEVTYRQSSHAPA